MYRLIPAYIAIALLLTCLMMGCFGDRDTPDVSDIDVSVEGINYDDAFLALESGDNLKSSLAVLQYQYPSMTQVYIDYVMEMRHPRDTSDAYLAFLDGFLQSASVAGLKHRVDSVHTDRSAYDRQFEDAFRYLKHYFPERNSPAVYYMLSEYSIAAFVFTESERQDALGISLDMYMGRDYPYKQLFPTNPAFSAYLTRSFEKSYVVKKGMDAIIADIVGFPNGSRMIDQMLHNGKKQYILEKLLPETPDSILWEYTGSQMDWVNSNELNLYSHFTSQEMLYSEDQMKYIKFVNPSPNSPGLPEEAPGRTANFIGYKIIEAYMKRSGDSLLELADQKNSQDILTTARYRPTI